MKMLEGERIKKQPEQKGRRAKGAGEEERNVRDIFTKMNISC